jgi:hypothetical protein
VSSEQTEITAHVFPGGNMKKYVIRSLIAGLCFSIGTAFAFVIPAGCERNAEDAIREIERAAEDFEKSSKLTFDESGVTSCDWPSSRKVYQASDKAFVTMIFTSYETEYLARQRFQTELDKAEKVFEREPVLNLDDKQIGEKAFYEANGKFYIIEFYKDGTGYYPLNITGTPTQGHMYAFEKYQTPNVLKEDTSSDEIFGLE